MFLPQSCIVIIRKAHVRYRPLPSQRIFMPEIKGTEIQDIARDGIDAVKGNPQETFQKYILPAQVDVDGTLFKRDTLQPDYSLRRDRFFFIVLQNLSLMGGYCDHFIFL